MKKADVIEHFGSQVATATALGVTKQAITTWADIIPEGVAYKVQVITKNKLKVDPAVYERLKAKRAAAA